MGRQRLRIKGSALTALVGRALVVLLAMLLVWYGAMLVLLALKLDPQTINDLSGYRDAYDYLSTLQPADIDRLVVAIAGLVVALAAGTLVWRGLPRPHLARSALTLPATASQRGQTDIQPRALERAVEAAAIEHAAVLSASARYDDGTLALAITTTDARSTLQTLHEVRDHAHESLARHQLEISTVNVTLAGYDHMNRKDLA